VLYRPFDVRWLYWQPDGGLLNRPRAELIPYWANFPNQRCLVLPQTPRRADALRPVASCAVAYNESAEPNARIFPLYRPLTLPQAQAIGKHDIRIPPQAVGEENLKIPLQAVGEHDLDVPTSEPRDYVGTTMIAPDWTAAANSALGVPDDTAGGRPYSSP